jgi:MFS family permease
MIATATVARTTHTHPVAFMILILPWGIITGYIGVAVAYFLAQAGVSTTQIAGLLALGFIPQTWKFLWAPIVDTTLSQIKWYMLAALVSAVGIFAVGAIPANASSLPLLTTVMLAAFLAGTFLCISVESLMAYATPAGEKGRAGGWLQAGNLGGGGVGGGAGLWMAQHLPGNWIAGSVLGAACLLCCLALRLVRDPPAVHRERLVTREFANVLRDLWQVARSQLGFLALLIFFLPIGTGAAGNLFPRARRRLARIGGHGCARQWRARRNCLGWRLRRRWLPV